jgi:hypothetical protein
MLGVDAAPHSRNMSCGVLPHQLVLPATAMPPSPPQHTHTHTLFICILSKPRIVSLSPHNVFQL